MNRRVEKAKIRDKLTPEWQVYLDAMKNAPVTNTFMTVTGKKKAVKKGLTRR